MIHFLRTILILCVLMFTFAFGAFAACPDVYFKTVKTQYLSIPIKPQVFSNFDPSFVYRDIDQDGFKDLMGVTSSVNGVGGNFVVLYKGSANGLDTPPVATNFGSDVPVLRDNALGDLNNDGKLDMIGYRFSNPTAVIYLNNGSGTFVASTETNFGAGNSEQITIVVDLNNDNRPDIITTNGSIGGLYFRLLSAKGTFSSAFPLDAGGEIPLTGDFNNDGKTDLIYRYRVGGVPQVKSLINQGNGVFAPGGSSALGGYGQADVLTDLNNDGRPDASSGIYQIGVNPEQKVFSLFVTGVSGAFTRVDVDVSSFFPGTSYTSLPVRAGDFDGDGLMDLMFFNSNFRIFAKNNGSLNFSLQKFSPPGDASPFINEFSGDGKADMVSANTSLLNENTESVSFKQNVCDRPGQTKFIDFDHNGATDIGFWHPADGRWQFYSGVADAYWGLGSLGDIPVPQDYDGDGQTDLAVYRNSTGAWYVLRSSDGQMTIVQFGLPGDKPVPGDFDADGKADLAVYRPSNGNWYAYQSQSGSVFAANFGLNGDIPLPMDYDGDGKADLAVFRPSNGTWYFFKTADQSYVVFNFGLSNDLPVPADYDNDGRADIALFRNGNWYIFTARGIFYVMQFGLAGDIPFPTAAGAQSRVRMSVYRPGNSSIYIYQGSSFVAGFNDGKKIVSWILPLD